MSCSLLKTLFPILPRTTSITLRVFIRKTILSDIRTANVRAKNHKLNRAVQTMLFGMVERGVGGEVVGDKGKLRSSAGSNADCTVNDGKEAMDHKILLMQLLSRVMGAHKLCVLGFYTYIIKYLVHRQLRVPAILVTLAQSVHDLTPPDAVTPVIRKLAQEFVHPGVASEVIAAGLNAIREICRRQPWSMEEDLLGDLVEYRKSRDKGVTAGARGLLQLYREVNPGMLKRRERVSDCQLRRPIIDIPFRVKARVWV